VCSKNALETRGNLVDKVVNLLIVHILLEQAQQSGLARTAPTKYKMDRLNAALEKLNDGVGLVHEYVTFCQLNKAGGPRSQGMRDLEDRGHDVGIRRVKPSIASSKRNCKSEPEQVLVSAKARFHT
jgi:hypothetical protein